VHVWVYGHCLVDGYPEIRYLLMFIQRSTGSTRWLPVLRPVTMVTMLPSCLHRLEPIRMPDSIRWDP